MPNKYAMLFIFLVSAQMVVSQKTLTWANFADVDFKPVYNQQFDVHFLMPSFGEGIRAYNGKEVSIKGYFLDLTGDGDFFLVSQNPMASCFFCGAAGPETIVEVRFKTKPGFSTDDVITVRGVLMLNEDDVNVCNYILTHAVGKKED